MGEFAAAVRDRLRDALVERRPALDWETEHLIRRTPVDVAGTTADSNDQFVAVELEWRRADPANNTATLFYYLDEGDLDDYDAVAVVQLFSGYYDLQSDGVSSKRETAEFVGRVAADSFDRVTFHPLRLPLDPPKRGGDRPEGWRTVVDETAERVADRV